MAKKMSFILCCMLLAQSITAQVRTTRWEVKIPSLWCEECESVIESRMMRYDGIMEIDAKWRAKKAVIRYVPDRIDTANIKVYISLLGFDTDEEKADEGQRKLLPECCQKPPAPKGRAATQAVVPPATTAATTPASPATVGNNPVVTGAAKPVAPAATVPTAAGQTAKPAATTPAVNGQKGGVAPATDKPKTVAQPKVSTKPTTSNAGTTSKPTGGANTSQAPASSTKPKKS